jgi:hypothetical protein
MQTLEFANKINNKNQKTETQVEELEYENKREGHGRNIALSRNVFRIVGSDTFYVQSESRDIYYFVKFKPDVFEICSCPDSWSRHVTCKHIFAVIYAIRKGTLKDVDKLPKKAKRDNGMVSATKTWKEEEYDF